MLFFDLSTSTFLPFQNLKKGRILRLEVPFDLKGPSELPVEVQ